MEKAEYEHNAFRHAQGAGLYVGVMWNVPP